MVRRDTAEVCKVRKKTSRNTTSVTVSPQGLSLSRPMRIRAAMMAVSTRP